MTPARLYLFKCLSCNGRHWLDRQSSHRHFCSPCGHDAAHLQDEDEEWIDQDYVGDLDDD